MSFFNKEKPPEPVKCHFCSKETAPSDQAVIAVGNIQKTCCKSCNTKMNRHKLVAEVRATLPAELPAGAVEHPDPKQDSKEDHPNTKPPVDPAVTVPGGTGPQEKEKTDS